MEADHGNWVLKLVAGPLGCFERIAAGGDP